MEKERERDGESEGESEDRQTVGERENDRVIY